MRKLLLRAGLLACATFVFAASFSQQSLVEDIQARLLSQVGFGTSTSHPVSPQAQAHEAGMLQMAEPAPGSISTLVGGWLGDGAMATGAALVIPNDVAIDTLGNLYIADAGNHRIRKVSPGGVISTFAGNGLTGFSGDGGQAYAAQLSRPSGIFIDANGNFYVADTGNGRIRKITPAGIISTIAGSGIVDSSGDGGLATNAGLNSPQGVIVNMIGEVYVSEVAGNRIRRFTEGGNISTVAGTGSAGFAGDGGPGVVAVLRQPTAMTLDGVGNLYFADSSNYRVRKLDTNGVITTVAGDGSGSCSTSAASATASSILFPSGVEFDASGNLYIASACNRIQKVAPGGSISTIAGTLGFGFGGDGFPAVNATLNSPAGLALGLDGSLYIADYFNHRVRRIAPDQKIGTVAGSAYSGDGGQALGAGLGLPMGTAFDAAGNLYIAESAYHRVRKVTPAGIISTFAGDGVGRFAGDSGPAVEASLFNPVDVAVDPSGNVYIADLYNGRIRVVDAGGSIRTFAGNGDTGVGGENVNPLDALISPNSLALDGSGNLYVSTFSTIRKIVGGTSIVTVAGSAPNGGFNGDGPALTSNLRRPASIAFDPVGNLVIADTGNNRIRKVIDGSLVTISGAVPAGFSGDGGQAALAALRSPRGLAFDAGGNLYFSDAGNHRIRTIATSGVITSIAGTGINGFGGDGGAAVSGSLALPQQITIDAAGNLLVSDHYNGRIRRIMLQGTTPAQPSVSINDVTITEGDTGTKQATFTISLDAPSVNPVFFGVRAESGTAAIGSDFPAGSLGGLSIAAGQTSASITININGDVEPESNETFTVNLYDVAGANVADAQGLGIITNDDRSLISISDVTLVEGNSGISTATFMITLSHPMPTPVFFDVGTSDGTANSGTDFIARSQAGRMIDAGRTRVVFEVNLSGDALVEADETFNVLLSNVIGATIADGAAVGTLTNDDAAALRQRRSQRRLPVH